MATLLQSRRELILRERLARLELQQTLALVDGTRLLNERQFAAKIGFAKMREYQLGFSWPGDDYAKDLREPALSGFRGELTEHGQSRRAAGREDIVRRTGWLRDSQRLV